MSASVLLFSLLKNCDTMKRKYFNDSSICWRIIGETRYEEEVGMLEKWESVKGTIKRWEKSYRRPLIGLLIVSFQDSADQ